MSVSIRPGRRARSCGVPHRCPYHLDFIDADHPETAADLRTSPLPDTLPDTFNVTSGAFHRHPSTPVTPIGNGKHLPAAFRFRRPNNRPSHAVSSATRLMVRPAHHAARSKPKSKTRGYITEMVGQCINRIAGGVTSEARATAFRVASTPSPQK